MGKRLYKTHMITAFKLIIMVVVIFFVNNFYLETFTSENFAPSGRMKFLDAFEYHYRYPREFINLILLILVPAIYYAFIRGIAFHEKGFYFNRGLPFMNRGVLYGDVETYKSLHPDFAISIHTKNGDVFVVADNNIGRVIAILDQQNIKGNLAPDEFVKLLSGYRRFIQILVAVILGLFALKKLGLF